MLDTYPMAVFFAFLSLIGWGVGDIFLTIGARRVGWKSAFFWFLFGGFVLSLLYLPFPEKNIDIRYLVLAFIIGVIHYSGNITYFLGLEKGKASLTGAIGGSFPALTILLSLVFFGEKISFATVAGIFLTWVGIILASFNLDEVKEMRQGKFFTDKSVIFALLTMLLWGVAFAFVRIPAEKVGWFWAGMPGYLMFVPMLFSKNLRGEAIKPLKDVKLFWPVGLFILFVTTADFSYNIGILRGFTSVVAPIAGSSPVLFVILANIIFREKLSKQQKIGIISSLAGIILISFASS